MRAIEAVYAAKEFVRDVLIAAGLIDGIEKTTAEIVETKDVMFWFIHVVDEKASSKESYVVYNIGETSPFKFGDGECFVRKVTVNMEIYSRARNRQELLETIENKFNENKVENFNLSNPIQYNTSSKMYQYSITIQLMVSDSSDEE